jgi:ATP-dependent helicase/nuclease subunit B
MGPTVSWVRYGRDAEEALRAAITEAKAGEPLAPVTVVVPSNHVGVGTRRLLASGVLGPVCERGVGLAAVTFVTPYRLAELLGASTLAQQARRPVSTPVIAAALRAVLTTEPGLFAPVADHPATETALVGAYRELRDLTDDALAALASASARTADVVRIHQATRARLQPRWYDEEDLMVAAADTVAAAKAVLGAVIVYLPQRLSRHAALLLGATTNATVLAALTGDERADAEVRRSVARLVQPAGEAGAAAGAGAGATSIQMPVPAVDSMAVVSREATRVVTTSDADEEVRAAVRAVVDAARQGVSLDRMAILHASPEPYARLVHEHLSGAGIPANGAAVMPVAARVAGRALLGLLALPEGDFRRQDVFTWLATAPIRHDGHRAAVNGWLRLSRQAGVVAGRDEWDRLLATLAADLDEEAELAAKDPDQPDWRPDRDRALAEQARQLRRFVLDLIDDLAGAASQPRPWEKQAEWARAHLVQLLGVSQDTDGDAWPIPERKAYQQVERVLDRLAGLGEIEGPVSLETFTRTLKLELDADLGRVGRLGEGVLVGSVGMGIGLDLDLVVILGLSEGSFPARVHEDSLLPDDQRATTADLPTRAEQVNRQHRQLIATLAGAKRHLLCVPRGDLRRSSQRVPSRWVLQIASTLAGERWWSDDLLAANLDNGWASHIASFDGALRQLAFPATEQEHRLRSLLAGDGHPTDPVARQGTAVVAARRSRLFSRFDGNLAGLEIPSPADRLTSATRMERWATCPFSYFLGEVLGVDAVDNPEEEMQISPSDQGLLIHDALERFVLEILDDPPAPDQPWTDEDEARMIAIGEAVCDQYEARGLTGRPIFWQRDRRRILRDLVLFLHHDSSYRVAYSTTPVAAELAFGIRDAALGPVPLGLPDGRAVRFRGKADRVDIAADGTLHVVDYKTGGSTKYKDLSELTPDQQGRRLQLAVYGEAARLHQHRPDAPVQSEYWFVSTRGRFERKGYPVTAPVLARVCTTLATVVQGVEAGVFPNYPTANRSTFPWVECEYCDPDHLGVTELRRRWERKRSDPALAPYADLLDG